MTDRDTFAGAALAGLLAQGDDGSFSEESYVRAAYRWADAMLAARKPSAKPSGVAEAYATAQQFSDAQDFVRYREEFEAWKKSRPVFVSESGKETPVSYEKSDEKRVDWNTAGDKSREASTPTGNTIDVEELLKELSDVYSMACFEDDVRATCRDAASAIERLRTWVNELQLSKAEIDALQHVVEDGRFVDLGDYGRLRSLLVRLRPEWEQKHDEPDRSQPVKDAESDRSKPVSDERLSALEQLSAMDQELELKHGIQGNPMIKARQYCGQNCADAKNDAIGPQSAAKTGTNEPRNGALSDGPDPDSRVWETPCTPQPHATPPQGSVPRDCSVPDSRTENEPVAWVAWFDDEDRPDPDFLFSTKERADEWCCKRGADPVPLYRHPPCQDFSQKNLTLTDAEREAVEAAILLFPTADVYHLTPPAKTVAATLRKLLERLS